MFRYFRLTSYQRLWSLLAAQWGLLLRLVVAACLLMLAEGFGLTLVFLVLGGSGLNSIWSQFPSLARLFVHVKIVAPQVRVVGAAAALILIMLVRGIAQYLQQVTETRLRITVEAELQQRLFDLLHDVQLAFIQQQQTGALMTALMQYTVQIGQLVYAIARGIAALVLLIAYVMAALWVSWRLSLLALLLMAITGLGLRPMWLTRAQKVYAHARDALKAAGAIAHESLTGMEQIHLFNNQPWSKARFQNELNAYHTLASQGSRLTSLVVPLAGLGNALLFAIILVGAFTFMPGDPNLLVLQMTLFLVLAYRLSTPVYQLNQLQTQLVQTMPALEAVLDLLQRSDKPFLQEGTLPFTHIKQGIRLENVTFHYKLQEPPTLTNVSLYIPKGQVTAIVGASGAGKTTLLNLLVRLYEPTTGHICVDGVDLRSFTLASWRDRLAVVNQEPFLFHASVLANLWFGRAEATEAQIQQAVALAQADAFIAELPQGFSTALHERGVRLSGGQRQRIALARALLRDAELLILDEATNELDAQTEQAFQKALAQGRGERAILVIAHRLSTVRDADQIYVLEKGRIVEHGAHDHLLRLGGVYYQLVQAQALA